MHSETFRKYPLSSLLFQLQTIAQEHYIDNLIIYFNTSEQKWEAVVYFEDDKEAQP